MKTVQKGFTLIELMIVVAIIGILASLAVSSYKSYTIRTQITEGINLAMEVKSLINQYWSAKGALPTSNTTAGLSLATSITSNYVAGLAINNGQINITYGNRANLNLNNQILTLTPQENAAGALVWICGLAAAPTGVSVIPGAGSVTTSINDKYLPTDCRS